MKTALQIFRKHPASISFYALYSYILFTNYMNERQYQLELLHNGGRRIGGVREFVGVLPFLVCVLFIIVSLINAGIFKKQRKFYLWLCLFIVLPYLLMANYFLLMLVPFLIIITKSGQQRKTISEQQ